MKREVNIEFVKQRNKHGFSPHEREADSGSVEVAYNAMQDTMFEKNTKDKIVWRKTMKKRILMSLLILILAFIGINYSTASYAKTVSKTFTDAKNYYYPIYNAKSTAINVTIKLYGINNSNNRKS